MSALGTTLLILWAALPAAGPDAEDRARVPRVVTVTPAVGAEDVDPSLTEIRVEFDMPMNRDGYSFTGGGPQFPTATGAPRWIDAYVCVLPVKLKPGWEYRFGVNSPTHRNFRSVWLVPAEPVECHFKTAGVAGIRRTAEEQQTLNVKSFDALCDAMRRHYSYLELRGIDWEALFAEHRRDVVAAGDVIEWARRAARMLSAANDVHLFLELDGQRFPTTVRDVRPNWSWDGVKSAIPNVQEHNPSVATGRTEDGIGYVLIRTWSADAAKDIAELDQYLTELKDARGLVLDVRPNGGGSETLARRVAGWFVDEPRVYARHAYRRGPKPGDFTPTRDRVIEPNEPAHRYDGPVAVLMGKANISSNEAFLLMMKQSPRATLVGERSYGSSGNPKPVFLPNGVQVFIPSWKAMTPDGPTFEGQGIAPDVVVSSDGVDFSAQDPVLAAALRLLR